MTDRVKALETQCKVLADRLGLALAEIEDLELEFSLNAEKGEENPWTVVKHMILSNDEISKVERKKRRKWVFYEMSMTNIRLLMQRALKAAAKAA